MIDCPAMNGPAVTSVLTIDTSALAAATPPLPVLSVLLPGFGSGSAAVAVALLADAPAAVIVAGTRIVAFAPHASEGIVHGNPGQPPPPTLGNRRVVGGAGPKEALG